MFKVSVIIPVYNAESTIGNAIDSVINQTMNFEDIELILVDDNSSDDSSKIIQEYADKYGNIKFIKLTENSGLPSKPRNVGIDNSTAPYLMFMDNDDLFPPETCETLYDAITDKDAEIVSCENCFKLRDGFYASFDEQTKEIAPIEDKSKIRCTCWGYIFKTELIKNNDVKFPLFVPEDGLFITEAFGNASKIFQMPRFIGYAYTIEAEDKESYIHSINNEKFLRYLNGHYPYLEAVRKYNINEENIFNDSVSILILMFVKVNAPHNERIDSLKQLHDFEKSLNFEVKLNSKPIDMLNSFILSEHYTAANILCWFAGLLYKNNRLKNLISRNYSNLKKIEL